MMKKSMRWLVVFAILAMLLTACSNKQEKIEYSGKHLTIGVVGKAPEINEEKVTFKEIPLNKLTKKTAKETDGVLVMKDQLAEASKEEYVDVFKEADVPFFFVESKMGMAPFLEKNLKYDDTYTDEGFDPQYVYGFHLTKEDVMHNWSFGLDNDKQTDENIENVFIRIFKTLDGETMDVAEPEDYELEDAELGDLETENAE